MKKIVLCLLLCFMSACTSIENNNSIVCSTITHDESVRIDITYTYDQKGKITAIEKVVSVMFEEKQLQEKTLEEYYNELYMEDTKGVHYVAQMDPKNNAIVSITTIDLSMYDFTSDTFELGKKEEYEDITKLIQEISSLGYYSCKE